MMRALSESGRFYGAVVNKWRIGKLSFSESVYPPNARIARHVHPRSYFSILVEGSYRETYSGGIRECEAATAVLHPPGEAHADHFLARGGRIFRFEIMDSDIDLRLARRTWDAMEVRNGKVRSLAARLYRESRHSDQFTPLAAEALALEIISEATEARASTEEARRPQWLLRATEVLCDALPEQLTLKQIAKIVGVHPVHLARVFRRHYGLSVGEFARNFRLELASRQLARSAAAVAQIAAETGFADQSHLCRTFKAVGGLTPNEFRATFWRNEP